MNLGILDAAGPNKKNDYFFVAGHDYVCDHTQSGFLIDCSQHLGVKSAQGILAAKIIDLLFWEVRTISDPDCLSRIYFSDSTNVNHGQKTKSIIFAAGMVWRPGEIHHQINDIPDQIDYFCIQDATDYFSGPKYAG